MPINAQDFADLRHLLPDSFASVLAIVGLENAFKLVAKFGGTSFKIGQNRRSEGRVLHFCLAEVIGEKATSAVEQALLGQRELYVPKCDTLLRELRNRQICRDFDALTCQQPYPMTGWQAANNLAREYDLCARQIWNILNTGQPETPDLFAV